MEDPSKSLCLQRAFNFFSSPLKYSTFPVESRTMFWFNTAEGGCHLAQNFTILFQQSPDLKVSRSFHRQPQKKCPQPPVYLQRNPLNDLLDQVLVVNVRNVSRLYSIDFKINELWLLAKLLCFVNIFRQITHQHLSFSESL